MEYTTHSQQHLVDFHRVETDLTMPRPVHCCIEYNNKTNNKQKATAKKNIKNNEIGFF